MTQNELKSRFERYALVGTLVFALLVLYWLVQMAISVYYVITGDVPPAEAKQSLFNLIYSFAFSALVVAIMVMVIRLLQSIRKGSTPFTMANVRRLRRIGWMLVVFEVLQRLTTRLFWTVASGRVEDGEKVVYYFSSTAGMVMIVGLAVLAISVVFQYGVELQSLSDETL